MILSDTISYLQYLVTLFSPLTIAFNRPQRLKLSCIKGQAELIVCLFVVVTEHDKHLVY